MTGLTPERVAARRWFRSKQRPIATVAEVDRARIPGAGAHLSVIAVAYVDGGESDLYLVPLGGAREEDERAPGAWAGLAEAIAAGTDIEGQRGQFRPSRTTALDRLLEGARLATLTERPLDVQQSNTSVAIGERLILKVYRRLELGVNPEVEMSAFLTDVGFRDTPALAGSLTYEWAAGSAAAAMLQELAPSAGDAWAAVLASLARDPAAALEKVGAVGRVTAELHAALASRPDHPSFPTRRATSGDVGAWRASAERQLAEAITAVDGPAHEGLVSLAPRVTARFADTFGAASGEAVVTRIHGDYHLGQLLQRRDGGFAVIDFEGEPARSLAERRAPGSPLRDLAGMLRSLDYAARSAEAAEHAPGFAAERWVADAREALIDGYGGVGRSERPLLEAFELEKACYEVRYEASNRPAWLWLPLAAVERLAG